MQPENALIARICHDLVTPFNAIGLGMEAYEASGDLSLLEHVKESVGKANIILKFMREMYSEKSETFRHSFASLNALISDFLRDRSITIDLKLNESRIPHGIAQIMMLDVVVAKESMPFGGAMQCHVGKDLREITLSYAGRNISVPDLNLCGELNHKNIMLYSLVKILEENEWELKILLQGTDVLIFQKKRPHA
ncbi:MAG: hypothetical protein LBT63_00205 [Holosporaceae bacterium]|jgi:hypothetical protein|nr:hypothetical protein [Holosporaceae bacterium]